MGGAIPADCKNLSSKSEQRSVSKKEENENCLMLRILTVLGRMYCSQPVWQICWVTVLAVRCDWLRKDGMGEGLLKAVHTVTSCSPSALAAARRMQPDSLSLSSRRA